MNSRRYTIEAHPATLHRFLGVVVKNSEGADALVDRITNSSDESYHFIRLYATEHIHSALGAAGFRNSYGISR